MSRLTPILLLVGISFFLGWHASRHHYQLEKEPTALPALSDSALFEIQTAEKPVQEAPAKNRRSEPVHLSDLQQFRQFLAYQQFDDAMGIYDQMVETDGALAQSMHAYLIAFLRETLEQGNNIALMALADTYLARYYNDIDVLMVVAEYQRRQGYPGEAARILQQVLSFAYLPGEQEKVLTALGALVSKTDELLSGQQRWVELLNFYQLLTDLDLSRPEFMLRQAMVYLALQDGVAARELLLPLTGNSKWGNKAEQLLVGIAKQESGAGDADTSEAPSAIPLVRRGNHYLISVMLNDESEATLMIDTGASMTSLSQSSFSRLSEYTNFEGNGERLFNTANGIARGDVYRADTFSLGSQMLQDVNVAVLDFDQGQGVDGLLGMNVLQYFQFEIDQDKQVLLLRPR